MARARKIGTARAQAHEFFPDFLAQREKTKLLDKWVRGAQDDSLYVPKHYNTNDEYTDLADRSPTPWLGLGITSVAQTCYVNGVRRRGSTDMMQVYDTWQQNRWDSRQNAVYRAAMGHGISYASALPGKIPLTGESSAVMRGYSALSTVGWYAEVDDEWPMFIIHAVEGRDENNQPGWDVELYDEVAGYRFWVDGDGENIEDWHARQDEDHNLGVTPFVRYDNQTDLEGRHTSEIEPFIPLAKRIDQDTFDRLIVQRFGAWKIRFITGLQRPKGMSETQYQQDVMKLKINDFLVLGNAEAKVGAIPETQMDGFIKGRDADLRDLSAVLQVPPYMFLGLSANMQAESLAAARSALMAKSAERKVTWGESHEQLLRLTAKIRGNREEMTAYDMEVKWADTEVRPLIQAAQALGNLASQVGVPLEMLWSMIPGWGDSDVERAKQLVESQGMDALLGEFAKQMAGAAQTDSAAPTTSSVPRGQVTKVP